MYKDQRIIKGRRKDSKRLVRRRGIHHMEIARRAGYKHSWAKGKNARFINPTVDHFEPGKQGIQPTRPLERVEIDHMQLDLFVIDPQRKMPMGRPWLTTAIDVYTRSIVGMYISLMPPSHLSVRQCLLNAISPKSYVRMRYPNIQNTWGMYGIMEKIVVDNETAFYSRDLEGACHQLGISIQYSPVRLANYKSSIERFFGTMSTRLHHKESRTTFLNILEGADYDSK